MRRHGYILSHIAPMTLTLIATTACEHKPLWMPETPIKPTEVEYDWSECRDAVTPGMTLYLYPMENDESPWLFNLKSTGGTITVPEGYYRAISYNNNTDGLLFRNTGNYCLIEAYTREGNLLDGFETPYTGSLPSRTADEPVVIMPDMMWTAAETVEVNGEKLTLTPHRITPLYRFTASDVRNISGVADVCASLSGLIGGIYLNDYKGASYPVTMPSKAKKATDNSITGSMVTFGIPPEPSARNILTLYFRLKDGSKHSFNFDVTTQIRNAPDPFDVKINVAGVNLPELPEPPVNPDEGGIGVDVDTWHTVDIELKPFI